MNALHEYGFQNGQQNGNGNGHAKIFSLKPATDPDTLAILDARRNATADRRLTPSMKNLFTAIVDHALHPGFYDTKGVVTLSDSVLGQVLGKSNRTIYTLKKKLAEVGYVWLTQKFKSNMWPITTYHLTCLHKPRVSERTDSDGTYGTGKGRHAPMNPGLGARRPGQPGLPLPGSRTTHQEGESEDLLRIAGDGGETLRPTPEENCGSDPKKTSGESRSKLRAGAEVNFGSEPKKTSGESRSALPAPPEADCQHLETQNRVNRGTESKTVIRLGNRAVSVPDGKPAAPAPKLSPQQRESENAFLAECEQVLGKAEMKENGGLWRTMFRTGNRTTLWACLHETKAAKTEQRIKTRPAAYMTDLWTKQRLGKTGKEVAA
jgi:hypothetical protein